MTNWLRECCHVFSQVSHLRMFLESRVVRLTAELSGGVIATASLFRQIQGAGGPIAAVVSCGCAGQRPVCLDPKTINQRCQKSSSSPRTFKLLHLRHRRDGRGQQVRCMSQATTSNPVLGLPGHRQSWKSHAVLRPASPRPRVASSVAALDGNSRSPGETRSPSSHRQL